MWELPSIRLLVPKEPTLPVAIRDCPGNDTRRCSRTSSYVELFNVRDFRLKSHKQRTQNGGARLFMSNG